MFHLLGNKVAHFFPLCFPQRFQTNIRSLHGGHFFRPFHALPFSDVFLATPATHTQITTELAHRDAGVFDFLGHLNNPWPDASANRHPGCFDIPARSQNGHCDRLV